jgi:chromosomal replication initiator protein
MNWEQITTKLSSTLSQDIYDLWIKPINCLHIDDKVIELSGPDRFFCSWVSENFLADIQMASADCACANREIKFTYGSHNAPQIGAAANESSKMQLRLPNIPKSNTFVRTLNPRYVFDEFVVGKSNEVAFSACSALAEGDTTLGRCLYINSATGLGKSHLTNAVAHHILEHAPGTRLNYLTAQQLTAEMVRSIQSRKMDSFKDKFQSSDVLLMEDMQSLTGKTKTQEELSLLFDVLLETGKTVIFTGTKTPRDIVGIDPAIQSRLSSGLVATIKEPDLQTRLLIVDKKARNLNIILTEALCEYIADQITGDVRQIRSALIGLKAKSNLRRMSPDLDMVKEVLADVIVRHQALTPEAIRDFIADQFNLSPQDLLSKSRKKALTFPRQISMYFSRKYTEKALSDIGKAFNRDHSTVVHAIRVITEAINNSSSTKGQIKLLDNKFSKQFLGG